MAEADQAITIRSSIASGAGSAARRCRLSSCARWRDRVRARAPWRPAQPSCLVGAPVMAWAILQYLLVGRYRHPRAGRPTPRHGGARHSASSTLASIGSRATRCISAISSSSPASRLTFWSWFALIVLAFARFGFISRVLHDEARLEEIFGDEYTAYRFARF